MARKAAERLDEPVSLAVAARMVPRSACSAPECPSWLLRSAVTLSSTQAGASRKNEPADETAVELGGEQHRKPHPFGTERMLWLIVFDMATQSLAHRSAIQLG